MLSTVMEKQNVDCLTPSCIQSFALYCSSWITVSCLHDCSRRIRLLFCTFTFRSETTEWVWTSCMHAGRKIVLGHTLCRILCTLYDCFDLLWRVIKHTETTSLGLILICFRLTDKYSTIVVLWGLHALV